MTAIWRDDKPKNAGRGVGQPVRPRSNELLQDIQKELDEGWSISPAIKRAGGSYKKVIEWSYEFPEWAQLVRGYHERKRG